MIDQDALLAAIRARIPFRVAQRLLTANGYPKGRTWDEITEKLDELESERGLRPTSLMASYVEALVCCDKLVTAYTIDEAELRGVHEFAGAIGQSLPDNPFVERFPFVLSDSALANIPQNVAYPVAVVEMSSATAIIYCVSRLVEVRESVDARFLNPNASRAYTQVIGIKRVYVQSFNAVVLPYFGTRVELYTDLIDGTPYSSAALDQVTLRNQFNSSYGRAVLRSPVNFFPAIRPLYESDEGEVGLLSHTVANGIKHERMRGNRCVRRERFHQGGVAAISGNLTPYQIALHWNLGGEADLSGRPELRLEGDYQMTYQASPVLTEATVRKCATYAEAKFVIDRLVAHLPVAEIDVAA